MTQRIGEPRVLTDKLDYYKELQKDYYKKIRIKCCKGIIRFKCFLLSIKLLIKYIKLTEISQSPSRTLINTRNLSLSRGRTGRANPRVEQLQLGSRNSQVWFLFINIALAISRFIEVKFDIVTQRQPMLMVKTGTHNRLKVIKYLYSL